MLENPKVLEKLKKEGKPSVEVPEEFKNKCVVRQNGLPANEYRLSQIQNGG